MFKPDNFIPVMGWLMIVQTPISFVWFVHRGVFGLTVPFFASIVIGALFLYGIAYCIRRMVVNP